MFFKPQHKSPPFTRSGDLGSTILPNGKKVSKSSNIVEFIGDLESFNANIGFCIALIKEEDNIKIEPEADILIDIQKDIQIIKHLTAGNLISIDLRKEISNIEKTIEDYTKLVRDYDREIIPGGSSIAASAYILYTTSRKIERLITGFKSDGLIRVLPYFNRLSTLLFFIARHINIALQEKEIEIRIK